MTSAGVSRTIVAGLRRILRDQRPAPVTWELVEPGTVGEAFAGRRVLITGAAGQIGGSLTSAFLRAGGEVEAIDLPEARWDDLRAMADRAQGGHRLTCTHLDIADEDAVRHFCARAETVDALVNNTGSNDGSSARESSGESWRRAFATNAFGPVALTTGLEEQLAHRPGGAVVFITSINAVHPSPWPAYAGAKALVAKIADDLALQFAPRGASELGRARPDDPAGQPGHAGRTPAPSPRSGLDTRGGRHPCRAVPGRPAPIPHDHRPAAPHRRRLGAARRAGRACA